MFGFLVRLSISMMTELIYHGGNSCQLLILAMGYSILTLRFTGAQCVAWGSKRTTLYITSWRENGSYYYCMCTKLKFSYFHPDGLSHTY